MKGLRSAGLPDDRDFAIIAHDRLAIRGYPERTIAGSDRGDFDLSESEKAVREINDCSSDTLLVGTGVPRQELWISYHRVSLRMSHRKALSRHRATPGWPTAISELFSKRLVVNRELILYALLIAIASTTRLWDLGHRALHHDESLHAYFSWELYVGKGFEHDPVMHGPFLFLSTALGFHLFGDSNYTARLMPALFGIGLVITPYFLRRWLGRAGAFATAFLLTISPAFLYYSRFLRHDIFVSFWTMLLVIALFRYLDGERRSDLYLGAAALSLSLSTKEVTYIFGFIGLTFLGGVVAWEWLRSHGGGGRARGAWHSRRHRTHARAPRPLTDILRRLDPQALLAAIAILVVIFVTLHTTFFTNPAGLKTGTVGTLTYWARQHGVRRGEQPWYYYLLLMPLYEFTPLLFATIGAVWYFLRRGRRATTPHRSLDDSLFVPFVLYWWVLSFMIYSWAGEKMPWLSLHLALPTIVLAGWFVGQLVEGAAFIAESRRRGKTAGSHGTVVRRGLLTIFVLLSLLTAITAWRASFIHGDIAKEMLIYVQTTPTIPHLVAEIENLNRLLAPSGGLKVYYDQEMGWPLHWYLRNYSHADFHNLNQEDPVEPPDAPMVIVIHTLEDKVAPFLGDYTRYRFPMRWWFPEDYKEPEDWLRWIQPDSPLLRQRPAAITWPDALRATLRPAGLAKLLRFFLTREGIVEPLGSTDFFVFVRDPVADLFPPPGDPLLTPR